MVHVLISAATFALAYAVGAEMQLMQMSVHGPDGLEAATLRTDFTADFVFIPQRGCAGPGRESEWLTVGKPYTPAACAIGCATYNYFTIAWKDANCKCADLCTDENGVHTSYAFVQGVPTVTSMVLHVNTSQQKGRRQVEAADHVVKGASWSQVGQDIDGEAAGDLNVWSVSLSSDGSRVAIGAYGNDGAGSNSGHVRVFGLSGNAWSQVGQDIDAEAAGDYSGTSVSLSSDGSRVAIGAYGNYGAGPMSGHVLVFGLSGNTWSQVGQDIDGEAAVDGSGTSVSLSSDGSRVAIGARNNHGVGSRSRLRALGQHLESGGAGHRWRSLMRLQWPFGVAEQRRQPRGHWSNLQQRRCWVKFWSRSRVRALEQHLEPGGSGHRWRSLRRS
ncbi:unnamed protein product [Prorocentrum cordatum]|uniref:Subtilisin n=1 Tax=Prorocentrum cordatum TaxID=2364126 RepID=A0ABN9U990_9DINO|nr:unnamed protein product [Polarella glacialis]